MKPPFDSPPRLLRLPEVLQRVPLSKPSIYKAIRAGQFPKPCKISRRASAWDERQVEAWIEERLNARDAA